MEPHALADILDYKKEKIEAIHIHQVLPVGYVGLVMKKLFRTPYLIFSHGTDIREATRTKWKTAMARKVALGAEQVVVNSEFLKARWLSALPELDGKITVVYPCPNEDFFVAPSGEEIAGLKSQLALDGKKVLLTVSRLTEGKGFPHLLRLLPELLKSTPNLVWLVVGDGPKKQELFETARKNNLQNVVRFVGASSHSEVKKKIFIMLLICLYCSPTPTVAEMRAWGLYFWKRWLLACLVWQEKAVGSGRRLLTARPALSWISIAAISR